MYGGLTLPKHIDFTTKAPEIRLAAHCIGLDHNRPYIRHGKRFYKPYRNYFTTPINGDAADEWVALAVGGYAEFRSTQRGALRFWLTRKGLDWLGAQLGITILNKED